MYPVSEPTKRKRARTKNRKPMSNTNEENVINETLSAARLIMSTDAWTNEHDRQLGIGLDTTECYRLYTRFLIYRKETEPVVKQYTDQNRSTESYLISLLNKHILLEANRENMYLEDVAIHRFVRTNAHHKFLRNVLLELPLNLKCERLSAYLDFSELLPIHTFSSLNIYGLKNRYFTLTGYNQSCLKDLFKNWFIKLNSRMSDIIKVMQKSVPDYSPHDSLELIANCLKSYPSSVIKSFSAELSLYMNSSEKYCGMILSLDYELLFQSLPVRARTGSLLPLYARSFARFWSDLGIQPIFDRMPNTVRYFANQTVSIINRHTYSPLNSPEFGIASISPKQFGLSDIPDILWMPAGANEIQSRQYVLRNMADYTTDIDEVMAVLEALDRVQYPYLSKDVSNGVVEAFSSIANRLNRQGKIYREMKRQNMLLYPDDPIEDALYKRMRSFPISVGHNSDIQPGSSLDLTKSVVLNLLAQRGLHFSIDQIKAIKRRMDNNQLELIKMPLDRIALFTNWTFGEFLCKRISLEISRYLEDKSYESPIMGVHKLIISLSPFIYGLTAEEARIEMGDRGKVSSGALDIIIDTISILVAESLPNWDALQKCHRKELSRIISDYVVRRFPLGMELTDTLHLFNSTYTPSLDMDKHNDTRNIDTQFNKRKPPPLKRMRKRADNRI